MNSQARSNGGIRTTSYAEAQRLAGERSRGANVSQIQSPQIDAYNSGSGNMLQKMKESTTEAERLRLKCREAALSSAARTQHEEIQRHLDRAKAQAQVNSLHHREAHEAAMASALALDPAPPQGDERAFGAEEVLLPGALEPFEVSMKPVEPQVEEAPAANKTRGMTSDADFSSVDRPSPAVDRPLPVDRPAPIDTGTDDAPVSAPAAPAAVTASAESREDVFSNMDEPIAEDEMGGRGKDEAGEKNSEGSGGIRSKESSSSPESSSGSYFSDSDESDKWPPSPPVLRFKMRMQFSNRFKPSDDKEMFQKMNEDLEQRFDESRSAEIKDPIIAWINMVFSMKIATEYQFEVGFPIIILTMLDAIYPKRVRWREVDWGFQYKRALQKNFSVLEMIWAEVNMEKAREFRVGHTTLRLENLSSPNTLLKDKLEFLKLMKRWFDQRIHHAGPYDPMGKRHEFVEQCRIWGQAVKFPNWIDYDKDFSPKPLSSHVFSAESAAKKEFDQFPEYKRLIWFLGSPEYQTM